MSDLDYNVDFRKESDDIVYFDASITNPSDKAQIISFSQTRPSNIVDKANDYYMAVIRFSIPHDIISIFNFDQDEYFVSIGASGPVQLQYVSRGNPFSNFDPNFRGVYTFQQFLDSLNNALATAHTGSGLGGNPPMMILNNDLSFSFIVDQTYNPATDFIFFNYPLYKFFLGIDATFIAFNAPNGRDYSINYGFLFNNIGTYTAPLAGNYYEMKQETKSQFLFSNIKYLLITSKSIPANKELVGLSNFINNEEIQAISDFIPIQQEFTNYDRTPWVYTSETPRLIDLQSDIPLRKIDFQVLIVDKDDNYVPLGIGPNESVDVKFAFYKKSLYNNEYDGYYDQKYSKRPTGLKRSKRLSDYHYPK